jgi:hypothetical protein
MDAMDLITAALQHEARVKLADVAALPVAKPVCQELMSAAAAWRRSDHIQLRHVEQAHRFAGAIPGARPFECLQALLLHHESYGGGLRWFVLRDEWVEPRTPWRGGSSRYRFRLWSLCRLAAQCGVLGKMPSALIRDVEGSEEEEISEHADE